MVTIGQQYEKFKYFAWDPVYSIDDGKWIGKVPEELGFDTSTITAKTLKKLQLGQDVNGNQMVALAKNGKHSPGRDIAFSIDKSLSIFRYSESCPDWYREAHDKAMISAGEAMIKAAVDLQFLTYKKTVDGVTKYFPIDSTDLICGRIFLHSISRNYDPDGHLHIPIFGYVNVDGKYLAISFDGLYTSGAKKLLDVIAKNEFIRSFKENSHFDIEQFLNRDSTTGNIELKAYDRSIIEKYSTRSNDIDKYIEEHNLKNTRATREFVNLLSRKPKNDTFTKEDLYKKLNDDEIIHSKLASDVNLVKSKPYTPNTQSKLLLNNLLDLSIKSQINALSKSEIKNSTNSLITEVLKDNPNFNPKDTLEKINSNTTISKSNIRSKNGFITTQFASYDNIRAERFVHNSIINGKGKSFSLNKAYISSGIKKYEELNHFELSPEQSYTVYNIVNSKDIISNVKGFAGTGKTTLFDVVNSIMKDKCNVIGLSNTGAASQVLQEATDINSRTLASFNLDSTDISIDSSKPTIFIVDEASLIGVKATQTLINKINGLHLTDVKIILSGDPNQIQSIAAGNVFNNSLKTDVTNSTLKHVIRQKDPIYRNIVENLYDEAESNRLNRTTNTTTPLKLKENGFIKPYDNSIPNNKYNVAVEQYFEYSQLGSSVIVTRTLKDMEICNNSIREILTKNNKLDSKSTTLNNYRKKNLKETDRRRTDAYKVGSFISTRKGSYCKITSIDKENNTLTLVPIRSINSNNNKVSFNKDNTSIFINRKYNKEYKVSSISNGVVDFYGKPYEVNLLNGKEVDNIQIYEPNQLDLRIGEDIVFTQNIDVTNDKKVIKVRNHTKGKFLSLNNNIYKFQLDNEILYLDYNDPKSKYLLESMQYGYAMTCPAAQGSTFDRVVSIGNETMNAEENTVAGTRGVYGYKMVISQADFDDLTQLNSAWTNYTENSTSIKVKSPLTQFNHIASKRVNPKSSVINKTLNDLRKTDLDRRKSKVEVENDRRSDNRRAADKTPDIEQYRSI